MYFNALGRCKAKSCSVSPKEIVGEFFELLAKPKGAVGGLDDGLSGGGCNRFDTMIRSLESTSLAFMGALFQNP